MFPFFKEFVAVEEAIDFTDDTWGESAKGYLSPQRINMSNYQVPVVHRGWAAAADDISAGLGSGEDPLSLRFVRTSPATWRKTVRNISWRFSMLCLTIPIGRTSWQQLGRPWRCYWHRFS